MAVKKLNKVAIGISYGGFEFDYLSDVWILNRNTTVYLDFLSRFKPSLAMDMRETLIYFAENSSGHHVFNIIRRIILYSHSSQVDDFSELGFLSFKATLTKKEEYKLSVVRGFIRQMKYLKLNKHIDESVYELTDRWRITGNEKGIAVLSQDPTVGPFSQIEFEAIGMRSAHKYAEGKLSAASYALILLFRATGRRPEQLATLKVKDFSFTSKYTGVKTYVVTIPKIKLRGGKFRSRLTPFGLVNSVGQIIEQHIKLSVDQVEKALNCKLTPIQKAELPLFRSDSFIRDANNLPKSEFLTFLKNELSHPKSADITRDLKKAIGMLKIISERTGKELYVTGYRFRYTLGSRAAKEGAGVITIARLLDHSDTQNVQCYTANVPENAVEISKIMNQPLMRYAAAFAGKVVKNEAEANRETIGATRIPCREKDCDVGSCGTTAFCQDYAPIACYLCPKFRPWENAPHHLVLEWLMEERDRLKADTN